MEKVSTNQSHACLGKSPKDPWVPVLTQLLYGPGPHCQSPSLVAPGLNPSPIPAIVIAPELFFAGCLH